MYRAIHLHFLSARSRRGLHLRLPETQLPTIHRTKANSLFLNLSLVSNMACAMFTNDHLEFHCTDSCVNNSHFIYMSLYYFQGQIKDSEMSSERERHTHKRLGTAAKPNEPRLDEFSQKR